MSYDIYSEKYSAKKVVQEINDQINNAIQQGSKITLRQLYRDYLYMPIEEHPTIIKEGNIDLDNSYFDANGFHEYRYCLCSKEV